MALARPFPQYVEPLGEEIIAERAWRLVGLDENPLQRTTVQPLDGPPWILRSIGAECFWPGPALVADKLPTRSGSNGIHAFKLGDAGECPDRNSYRWHQAVVGTVALSGIVQVHKYGYRAERATIQALTLRWGHQGAAVSPAVAAALAERYQCPVEIESQEEYEAAYEAHRAREVERAWDSFCAKHPIGQEKLDLAPIGDGHVRDLLAPPGTLLKPERKGSIKVIRFIEVATGRYVLVPVEKFARERVEIDVPDDAPEMGGHFARLYRRLRDAYLDLPKVGSLLW